jgi:hypothetical protein
MLRRGGGMTPIQPYRSPFVPYALPPVTPDFIFLVQTLDTTDSLYIQLIGTFSQDQQTQSRFVFERGSFSRRYG